MAVGARTRAGLRKCRAATHGSRVAVVAPASGFDRGAFERGLAELTRLGFEPVYDESVFERQATTAGSPAVRAEALRRAWTTPGVDVVLSVRGGYGSVETLPLLDTGILPPHPASFVGYSDVTSLHTWLNLHVGVTSVHGAMIDGRLAEGETAYDARTFLGSLGPDPLGELSPDGLEVIATGEASGVLLGGTITQLAGSLGTPFAFKPPVGAVLFLDEVGERPYKLQRLLTQLRQADVLAGAAAIVFGQMPRCDEPGGRSSARAVIADTFADFTGPVLFGFPSGHTTTPLLSLPFGVHTRVVAGPRPCLVLEEAAAV